MENTEYPYEELDEEVFEQNELGEEDIIKLEKLEKMFKRSY